MNKNIYNRLARIEGQVKGIYGMIEEGRSCEEVLLQLLAVRSALDSLIVVILKNYIEGCKTQKFDTEQMNEILDLLVKYLSEVKG